MSEPKFSKGPWEVAQGNYPSMKEIRGASFRINCVMWATDLTDSDYAKRSADLSLISAAPEMYHLLIKAKETLLSTYDVNDYPAGGNTDCDKVSAEIDKLLAKARGELVDLTKSTFTAEEAAELMSKGYGMIECAESCLDNYWIIAFRPQPSWLVTDDAAPVVDMSINLPDGVHTVPSGNKENKEPSW